MKLLSYKYTLVCAFVFSCIQLFCDPMDYSPPGPSVLGDSPDKNTGVGFHALLPTQELSWGLLLCRRSLHQLGYQESPGTTTQMPNASRIPFY